MTIEADRILDAWIVEAKHRFEDIHSGRSNTTSFEEMDRRIVCAPPDESSRTLCERVRARYEAVRGSRAEVGT